MTLAALCKECFNIYQNPSLTQEEKNSQTTEINRKMNECVTHINRVFTELHSLEKSVDDLCSVNKKVEQICKIIAFCEKEGKANQGLFQEKTIKKLFESKSHWERELLSELRGCFRTISSHSAYVLLT